MLLSRRSIPNAANACIANRTAAQVGQLHSATSPNENSWDNKAVRDQLTKAQQTTDQAERTRIYQQVAQVIYDECPRLPIAHTTPPLLFRKNVNGYVANPTSTEFYNTVTLS